MGEVRQLTVNAGQTFYLLINGTTAAAGTNGYQLTFTGTCGLDCTLPIGLTSFSGKYNNEMIDLTWNAESGTGNDYYILEKNIEGHWTALAKYNSMDANSYYLFTDTNPASGNNMYRVKIVDTKGEILYSSIVSVNTKEQLAFKVFPNPASSEVKIELFDASDIQYPIVITNSMGQEVLNMSTNSSSESAVIYTISLDVLNPGLYIIHYGAEVRTLLKE